MTPSQFKALPGAEPALAEVSFSCDARRIHCRRLQQPESPIVRPVFHGCRPRRILEPISEVPFSVTRSGVRRNQPPWPISRSSAGKWQPAEVEFRAALGANGTSVSALDNLALALSAQKRFSAAARYWKQALSLRPDSPEILLSLAVATYKDGDVETAKAMLKQLTTNHPDDKEAHFTLANILAHSLLFGEAAKEFGIVVHLDPKNDAALFAYAKALSNAGSYQDAIAPGEQYVSRSPKDPEGHLVLGTIYRRLAYNAKWRNISQSRSLRGPKD